MTIWFYVKTDDTPEVVGELVCAANVFEDKHPKGKYSWVVQSVPGEEQTWQIMGKFEQVSDLTTIALVYRAGDSVVFGEVNDDFVPNFVDPLLEKYGFNNLKWLQAVPKQKSTNRWPIAP